MSGSSGRATPGSHILVLRAVFVPDGQAPPDEWAAVWNPLKFPATYDSSTGEIVCGTGNGFDQGIGGEWHPDPDQSSADEDAPKVRGHEAQGSSGQGGQTSGRRGFGGNRQAAVRINPEQTGFGAAAPKQAWNYGAPPQPASGAVAGAPGMAARSGQPPADASAPGESKGQYFDAHGHDDAPNLMNPAGPGPGEAIESSPRAKPGGE